MAAFIKVSNISGAGANGSAGGLSGFFGSIARFGLLILGAGLGLVFLLFAASAALVIVLTIAVIGFFLFVWFWARAKFFGKPFGGAKFQEFKAAAQSTSPFEAESMDQSSAEQGDVLDAHKTPDGWTVNE